MNQYVLQRQRQVNGNHKTFWKLTWKIRLHFEIDSNVLFNRRTDEWTSLVPVMISFFQLCFVKGINVHQDKVSFLLVEHCGVPIGYVIVPLFIPLFPSFLFSTEVTFRTNERFLVTINVGIFFHRPLLLFNPDEGFCAVICTGISTASEKSLMATNRFLHT